MHGSVKVIVKDIQWFPEGRYVASDTHIFIQAIIIYFEINEDCSIAIHL